MKSEHKIVEQVLPGDGVGTSEKGYVVRKEGRMVNMVQKLYAHVCKCKNCTCSNYFRKEGRVIKRSGEGVNSCIIYLIHYKNFCKCHYIPTQHNNLKNGELEAEREKKLIINKGNFRSLSEEYV
jgi:hypothetical protein